MSNSPHRKLSLGNLRAFDAVARRLSFSAAADELHLTQSAISRQVKSLEDELGAALFVRGTRHVEVTPDGQVLRQSVEPFLARLDAGVRQIRQARSRHRVSLTTFASFASLWLLPRLEAFQRIHPDIDIRVSAHDALAELDDPELDLALRYVSPEQAPPGAVRLFGEVLTPVVSRSLFEQTRSGAAPPLRVPADLALHTLAEEDDGRASGQFLSWRHWLGRRELSALQPRRWLYLNFTYQQVQAALAGHGVALARMALVADTLVSLNSRERTSWWWEAVGLWAKVGAVGNSQELSTASPPVRAAHRPQVHSLAAAFSSLVWQGYAARGHPGLAAWSASPLRSGWRTPLSLVLSPNGCRKNPLRICKEGR